MVEAQLVSKPLAQCLKSPMGDEREREIEREIDMSTQPPALEVRKQTDAQPGPRLLYRFNLRKLQVWGTLGGL